MASELKLSGTTARVILQGNDTITADQTFTFPNSGGAVATLSSTNSGTGGSAGSGQVVGYQQGLTTCAMANDVTLASGWNVVNYTRVGNQVTVTGQIQVNSTNNNVLLLNNLPYDTEDIEGRCYVTGSLRVYDGALPAGGVWAHVMTNRNSPQLRFTMSRSSSSDIAIAATASGFYSFSISYVTDDTTWTPNTGSAVS